MSSITKQILKKLELSIQAKFFSQFNFKLRPFDTEKKNNAGLSLTITSKDNPKEWVKLQIANLTGDYENNLLILNSKNKELIALIGAFFKNNHLPFKL